MKYICSLLCVLTNPMLKTRVFLEKPHRYRSVCNYEHPLPHSLSPEGIYTKFIRDRTRTYKRKFMGARKNSVGGVTAFADRLFQMRRLVSFRLFVLSEQARRQACKGFLLAVR